MMLVVGCAPNWTAPTIYVERGSDDRTCATRRDCIDLVVVVDTSRSTGHRPGEKSWFSLFSGEHLDASPGTTLSIELEGLAQAAERLDSSRHAVGIVGFAGQPGDAEAAWIESEITNDYEVIADAVARMRRRGASGASWVARGVEVGVELADQAYSEASQCKAMVVVTDGVPTLPPGDEDEVRKTMISSLTVASKTVSPSLVVVALDSPENLRNIGEAARIPVVFAATPAAVATFIVSAVDRCGTSTGSALTPMIEAR